MKEMQINLQMLADKDWAAPDIDSERFLELHNIAVTINNMKHEICNHITELKEKASLEWQLQQEHTENERKQRLLTEAQLAALKLQINPHFLFNILDLIGKASILGDPEKATELIEDTAKILRYSLQSTKMTASLREELDIVKTYLFLQQARFGDAIGFEIKTDDTLMDIPIPSMIIQPLIENCFKHGFDGKNPLRISVMTKKGKNQIEICVRDNGKGFDAEQRCFGASGGIGLKNVRRRIELEYGNPEPLRIQSEVGRYTEVTIFIPWGS
jgi:sensor histidine kinase YesM